MYVNLKFLNFFLIQTKFIFYFYNFSFVFFKRLPLLRKIELLLPFKKKFKFILNSLIFLSINLLCQQLPCYKLISTIEVWKKGKRFNANDIKIKFIYLTLRSHSLYSFLDCLTKGVFKESLFSKHFFYQKKKLEDLMYNVKDFNPLKKMNTKVSSFIIKNQTEHLFFIQNISTNSLLPFSFVFFFNLLDFPLVFTFFNLLYTLLNFKFYVVFLSALKMHSLFFLKFLNLLV
jgi:hypothetical protein